MLLMVFCFYMVTCGLFIVIGYEQGRKDLNAAIDRKLKELIDRVCRDGEQTVITMSAKKMPIVDDNQEGEGEQG